MNTKQLICALLSLTALIALPGKTSAQKAVITKGPESGVLMAIGGGALDSTIMMAFYRYAGGAKGRVVVIPTALGDNSLNKAGAMEKMQKRFEAYGYQKVTIMHTRDTAMANLENFIEPLKSATAIFFIGGRQWRIADGFLNTKAHQEMFKLLGRGGVIAGTSAGATIQGSYLARGDTKNNQIMMGDHEEGLGFISNIAIDQHILTRNRQFDMFDILDNKPELLGVGVSENTAIVVKNHTFEVIGASYVSIYDGNFWSREGSNLKNLPEKNRRFYLLKAGDRYDMKARQVINTEK